MSDEPNLTAYLLVDPRDGAPFYAGMTRNFCGRLIAHRSTGPASQRLAEIKRVGLKCRVRVWENLTFDDAKMQEARLIVSHGEALLNRRRPGPEALRALVGASPK